MPCTRTAAHVTADPAGSLELAALGCRHRWSWHIDTLQSWSSKRSFEANLRQTRYTGNGQGITKDSGSRATREAKVAAAASRVGAQGSLMHGSRGSTSSKA